MTMHVKTMEFSTIIVKYDYKKETMEIKPKPLDSDTRTRDWPSGEGIVLPKASWLELGEAFAGIGHEVLPPGKPPYSHGR